MSRHKYFKFIQTFISKNAIHVLFVGLIISTIGVGLGSFRFLDFKSKTTLAAPVFGSVASNGGNITIDKTYYNGTTENDNISVNGGDNVTVRLKYNNTGNQTVTAANIKDSLPAGFAYVPGSTKNCLVPTTAETVCDSGDANQKDSLFTALTGPIGISPTAGLYDAADTGATGTAYNANSGLLEIGKKRYLNLNQCYYYTSFTYSNWINNTSLVNMNAGTNVSNSIQPSVSCGSGDNGYINSSNYSSVQVLDLQNKKYLNLNQCVHNLASPSDSYTNLVNNNGTVWNTGTNASNVPQFTNVCALGYPGYVLNNKYSNVKPLQVLSNRYINLAHCGYSNGSDNTVGAIDNITNASIAGNTSTSNAPTTLSCGSGQAGATYQAPTSGIQNLDLLDQTRGQGYIEYKMTAPATTGIFGTNVSLVGTDNVGSISASDLGSANQVNINGAVTSSSSSSFSSSSMLLSSSATKSSSVISSSVLSNSSITNTTPNNYASEPAPLSVAINQSPTQADPTTNNEVKFKVVFGKPIDVTSFTLEDVKLTGTATPVIATNLTQVAPNDGTTFEFSAITSGSGTIKAEISKTFIGPPADVSGSNSLSVNVTKVSTNPMQEGFTSDPQGNLYTTTSGTITKTTPAGINSTFSTLPTSRGLATTGRNMGLVFDTLGNTYMAANGQAFVNQSGGYNAINSELYKRDSIGNLTLINATAGNIYSQQIRIDKNNNVYVLLLDKSISTSPVGKILKIQPNGNVSTLVSNLPLKSFFIFSIDYSTGDFDVDSNGNIYYADPSSNQILKIDSLGNITTYLTIPNANACDRGLIIDSLNAINVSCTTSSGAKIYRFDSSGNQVFVVSASADLAGKSQVDIYGNLYFGSFMKMDKLGNVTTIYNANYQDEKSLIDTYGQVYSFKYFNGGYQSTPYSLINKVIPAYNNIIYANTPYKAYEYNKFDSISIDNTVTVNQVLTLGTLINNNAGNPIKGIISDIFPSIALVGCNIPNGTTATFLSSGSSTVVNGTIKGCVFSPIVGELIPNDAPIDLGIGILSASGLNVNVNTEFRNPVVVTINQSASQLDPTSSSPVKFVATFSEPIDPIRFTASKINITGTSAGAIVTSINQITPNDGTTFEINVTASNPGTIILDIPKTVIKDIENIVYSTSTTSSSSSSNATNTEPPVSFDNNTAFDSQGNKYSGDTSTNIIYKTTLGGVSAPWITLANVIGSNSVSGVFVDSSDNIYVNDHKYPYDGSPDTCVLTKYTPSGAVLSTISFSDCGFIHNIDNQGNIYFIRNLNSPPYNKSQLVKVSPSGVQSITDYYNKQFYVASMFVDYQGNIFVSGNDEVSSHIYKIAPSGILTETTSGYFSNKIVADKFGYVYILNNNSYQKFSPDLKLLTTSTSSLGNLSNLSTDTLGNVYEKIDTGNPNYTISKLSSGISNAVFNAALNSYNVKGSTSTDNVVTLSTPIPDCPPPVTPVYLPNIFSSIHVLADTSATDCGVIYTPLQVTINQATTQIDPTATGPVKFTVVFNQPINPTTFTASDIVLSGTAPGLFVASIPQTAPNDGTTFEVIVNTTGNGTVVASIPQKTVSNSIQALNPDTPVFNDANSTSTDNTVTINQPTTSVIITVPTLTNSPKPPASGTCNPGDNLTVTFTPTSELVTIVCPNTGTYTTSPTNNIPDGNYCASIVATGNGATANNGPSCGIIDTSTFVTIVVPALTNNPKPPITGTCEAAANLVITVTPTNEIINLVCPANGNFSTNPTTVIPDGNYSAKVVATDLAGNSGNATGNGTIDTTTFVTISVPTLTNDNTPTITGTCETGATLAITITPTNEVINNISCVNGGYTTTPANQIPDGNYCDTIITTDLASNSANAQSCGTVDTVTFVTVNVPTLTNNPKPPIAGTCEIGATVILSITTGSNNNPNQVLPSFVCSGGTYSVNPPNNIPDGAYCANASITDLVGNIANATPSCGIIDTSTFVTISVPNLTNNPKPPIAGTCEAGINLVITVTPTNEIINLACPSNGNYSTILNNFIPDGAYSTRVVATDLAGNTANATGSGIVDTSTFVTIVVPPITNNPRPVITGTCETGASIIIKITVGGNNSLLQTLSSFVCNGGIYSINPTVDIPEGAYCAKADAIDVADNSAFAQGCGDIFVTVDVPATTTDNKPEIVGTCTPSIAGGYQVPVVVVIKIGTGYVTVNETISTTCTIAGTYRVRPNIIIPVGPFQVIATATDAIGNQAVAVDTGLVVQTIIPNNPPGGVIIIKPQVPEVFDHLLDPYDCGKSITGKVTSNFGIKNIVVKLFSKKENGFYEIEPKYIYRPTIDSLGNYTIDLPYADSKLFAKGLYKVEYMSQSNTNTIKFGTYLANITDQCQVILPTVMLQNTEITADGKITVRTGGYNQMLLPIIILLILAGGYIKWKIRLKNTKVWEVFGK
jgi:Bacterial Ig-like domain